MIVSFNEIETTILKAARGAGMEWGLAEEAARAARFLSQRDFSFEAPFLELFSSRAFETFPVREDTRLRPRRADQWLCPIRAGAYLSDLGGMGVSMIERLVSPILLLPFLSREDRKIEIAWKGVRLRLDPSHVMLLSGEPCALAVSKIEEVSLSQYDDDWPEVGSRPIGAVGAKIDEVLWAKLQAYETLTFVPASAKSRASGAGAGEIDND